MDNAHNGVRPWGISIVVCCHNSAQRLPPTLAHLTAQQTRDDLRWEVIVVDNASTDDTTAVARAEWPAGHPIPFRVVPEPRAGLSYARQRGFDTATYEILSFVDDDNWLAPDWVQRAADLMAAHPEVGASGGALVEQCEVTPPAWFGRYKAYYALWPPTGEAGPLTGLWDCLCGAGMSIRRTAWERLRADGFRHQLAGRQGSALTSGEDIELMYAFRMAGWTLWHDPALLIQHFIPAGRLQWSYLRRLRRGGGAATVGLDPYSFALQGGATSLKERLRRTWGWQVARTLKSLAQYRLKLLLSSGAAVEGSSDLLEVEHFTGRLLELWRGRKLYARRVREVQQMPWVRQPSSSGASVLRAQYEGVPE